MKWVAAVCLVLACTRLTAAEAVAGPVFSVATPEAAPAGLAPWGNETERLLNDAAQPVVLQQGRATFYANRFHGRRTASGEAYDKNALTAAHRTLPFGTEILVRSLRTGKEVVVRIIDRGPYLKGRIIDLSRAAAEALGIHRHGVSEVQLIQLQKP